MAIPWPLHAYPISTYFNIIGGITSIHHIHQGFFEAMFEHVAIPQLVLMGIEEPLGNSLLLSVLVWQFSEMIQMIPEVRLITKTSELQMLQKMELSSHFLFTSGSSQHLPWIAMNISMNGPWMGQYYTQYTAKCLSISLSLSSLSWSFSGLLYKS